MRKPKGKLVALLAVAVAMPLLTLAVLFWKDVYCHVFLDPQLVGRWSEARAVPDVGWRELKFDKVGNLLTTTFSPSQARPGLYSQRVQECTYRIDGDSMILTRENGESGQAIYRIEGDTLTSGSSDITYRRVPDDS